MKPAPSAPGEGWTVRGLALQIGSILIRAENTKHGDDFAISTDLIQDDVALN